MLFILIILRRDTKASKVVSVNVQCSALSGNSIRIQGGEIDLKLLI